MEKIDLSKIEVDSSGRTRDGDVWVKKGTLDSIKLVAEKVNELVAQINTLSTSIEEMK